MACMIHLFSEYAQRNMLCFGHWYQVVCLASIEGVDLLGVCSESGERNAALQAGKVCSVVPPFVLLKKCSFLAS